MTVKGPSKADARTDSEQPREGVRMRILICLALPVALGACNVSANLEAVTAGKTNPLLRSDAFQAVAGTDKLLVAVGSPGVVVVSADGGANWKRTDLPGTASLIAVTACPDGSWAALDFYRKVWVARPAADEWVPKEIDTKATPMAIACDPQNRYWVVGSSTTVLSSDDKGASWTSQDFDEDAILMSIQFLDADNAVITGEFGHLLKSSDGGKSWQAGNRMPNDFFPYATLFTDPETGWVSGLAGVVMHTTDGGESWTKMPTTAGAPIYGLVQHRGELIGFGLNGLVQKLAGTDWQPIHTQASPFLRAAVSLGDRGLLVAGGSGTLTTLSLAPAPAAPAEK